MWIPDDPSFGGGGGGGESAPSPSPAAPSPSPSPSAAPPSSAVATSAPDSSAAPAPTQPSAPSSGEATPAPDGPVVPATAPDGGVVQPAKSFLSESLEKSAPAEAKPTEAPKPAEAKPGETPAAVVAPAEPAKIAWEYTVPEEVNLNAEGTLKGKIQFDEEAKTRVNSMLEAFASKPGDKASQQALVDFHIERLAEQQKQQDAFNKNFWNDTRKQWREEWAADPEIGGSGMQTSRGVAARAMDVAMRWHDTSPENKAFQRQLNDMFEMTGAGDHPAMGKLLTRLGRFLDESPPPPSNIKPPPNVGQKPGRGSLRDRYQNMP